MQSKLNGALTAVALSAGLFGTGTAYAGPAFSDVVVFGDSLSDNGNLAEDLSVQLHSGKGFPNPPFFHDAFTNGPVALDIVSQRLSGHGLTPSLWGTGFTDPSNLFGGTSFVPGSNYAVASARASTSSTVPTGIDLPEQIAAYTGHVHGQASASALYVVLIGGNDVRNDAMNGTDSHSPTSLVQMGVNNEIASINTLIAEGAKHILVSGVGDVGSIPESKELNDAAAATADSKIYNQSLVLQLQTGVSPHPGTEIDFFDFFKFSSDAAADFARKGFNTTDPCYINVTSTIPNIPSVPNPPGPFSSTTACGATPGDPTNHDNINQLLFWDHIHPTQPVQAKWADGLTAAAAAAVPEPASLSLLFGAGLAGWAALRRRKSA